MDEMNELARQVAMLQEKVRSLQEEVLRSSQKQYLCTLEPGKQAFWIEVER